jgi:DNA-binding transcriptional regulator YdaS (Cro superfamily)
MKLSEYIAQERGRQAKLAKALNVPSVSVYQWAAGIREVPAKRCPSIERHTGGAVTCEELLPDVDWAYLRRSKRQRRAAPAQQEPSHA